MIEVDKLKALVKLMVDNDLMEIDLRDSDKTVTIKRAGPHTIVHAPAHLHAPSHAPPAHHHADPARPAAVDADAGLIAVTSPMVGTFYSQASPDAPPFVGVGKAVGPETVVCLIEAMKVFNEVKAECAGLIERVLVKSGEPVEFGQKLFLVRPG